MSSSQQTTNLGLPIYGNNDVPDWRDTNSGFDTLDNLIGSCADVQLDFAHPLHKFTTGNLTYTTTKECYLYGTINASQNTYTTLTIDGNVYASVTGSQSNYYEQGFEIGPIRLNKGTTVTLSSQGWNPNLYVLEGTIVSGNTYVYNEAEVELNYTTPLHTFSSGHLSYTATKDCWLVGTLWAGSSQNKLTINSVDYFRGYYQDNVMITDCNIPPLKLTRGDVVTVQQEAPLLHVVEGTVSGSVGTIGYPDLDLDNPLYANTGVNVINYTCTQDCYMFGAMNATSADITSNLLLNGNTICRGATGLMTPVPLLKLHSGDVVTSSKGINNGYLMICKER